MRVVDEPTAVEARPRRFIWTQTWLDVSGVGRQWKSRSIRSTYSVLPDPRFSSQSRENKAPQGINVESSQREIRRGAGRDTVQEETGELDHYPIIDITFHEDPVVQYLGSVEILLPALWADFPGKIGVSEGTCSFTNPKCKDATRDSEIGEMKATHLAQ